MFIPRNNKRSRAGMTLVEMMIGLGIGSVVLGGVMGTSIFTSRNFVAMGNYCDLNASGRNALDSMSADIRQTDYLVSYTTNQLVFQTTDPSSQSNKATLTYTYDPTAQTLTRSLKLLSGQTTTNTVLLANCSYYHFDLYQRNVSTNGTDPLALISTNQPSLVKAVDLTWICSRAVLGLTYNSEDVQSARVVIRKD